MKSEEDLLRLIFGDIQDFKAACLRKMTEFTNNPINIKLVKKVNKNFIIPPKKIIIM